ncbi:MAG: hypothetical protein LC737_01920, partial [Chloroflexi bacterium]|nr:hypothetical protein [Chloroflexota bacterium]
ILGFRVYRADVPNTNYVRVADESVLKSNVFNWPDPVTPSCGKSYYVVAVYNDGVTSTPRESARSTTTWYSRTCASLTPTPKP